MKQVLIIFTKNLIYGQVKTRLAATIGNDMALNVYDHLLQHTVAVTHILPVEKIVFYSTPVEEQDYWSNEIYKKQIQSGNDLGQRMQHAFAYAFAQGNKEVAIIGTDCLQITSALIMTAYAGLKKHDVVIGPATDGGYYLLAMKQMHQLLFKNIAWSTDEVLKQTLVICSQQNLSVYQLPVLSDIDNENDLTEAVKQMLQIKSGGV